MPLTAMQRGEAENAFYDTAMDLDPHGEAATVQYAELRTYAHPKVLGPMLNKAARQASTTGYDPVAATAFTVIKDHPRLFGRALAQTAYGVEPGLSNDPLLSNLGVNHYLDFLARQSGFTGQARLALDSRRMWVLRLNPDE